VILALAPAIAAGIIEPDVIADTKTGLSGAGRALGLNVHFSEADESVSPYGLDGHRHVPEMTQELGLLAEAPKPRITFVPHYTPMTRGILSTCYARAKDGALPGGAAGRAALMELYRDFYANAPFARVSDTAPATKHVMGTNVCVIHPTVNLETGAVVVASALDNLGKGAAGAGVQCMNVMLGLRETAGLDAIGLYP
jgi:N-acetyl-gamma-glutamyl-phosphate reductase